MRYALIILYSIAILVSGCDRRPEVQSEPSLKVNAAATRILKVAVYRDGKVEIDGGAMSVDDAVQRIEEASGSEASVYYYREAGEEEEPNPNASKILAAVIDAKLPISLSSERDFSTYVDETGKVKKRDK